MQKREIQVMIKSTKTNQRRISLMDYCIRNLLELTDKNFITDENWLETVIENHELFIKLKELGQILMLLVYIVLVKMSLNILIWNIKLEFQAYLGVRLF